MDFFCKKNIVSEYVSYYGAMRKLAFKSAPAVQGGITIQKKGHLKYGSAMRKWVSKSRGSGSFKKKKNGCYFLHCFHQYRFLYGAALRKRTITTIKKRDMISFQSNDNGDDVKNTRKEDIDIIGCNKISSRMDDDDDVLSASCCKIRAYDANDQTTQERKSVERFWTKPRCRVLPSTQKFRFTIDWSDSDSDLVDEDDDDQEW